MDYMGMRGTKLKIFKAAVEMFAHSSFFNISMRDIANAVGIKPASIYNHFDSKDELLKAIFAFYDYTAARHTPQLWTAAIRVPERCLPNGSLRCRGTISARFCSDSLRSNASRRWTSTRF